MYLFLRLYLIIFICTKNLVYVIALDEESRILDGGGSRNILGHDGGAEEKSDLTVASFNIWNVMFHWEVRKLFIAEMIKMHDIDVIGFQEVRAHKDKSHNQLYELQDLLPSHKWLLYHPTRVVKEKDGQSPPGWELEGIGLMSTHRILSYHVINLTESYGEDPTQRALLSAQLSVDGTEISVIVTHYSYDRSSQCQNSWDVLKYLQTSRAEKMILLGDFNAYNNYHWPIELLMNSRLGTDEPDECKKMKKPWFQGHPDYKFFDAWVELNPRNPGFTFSNMPDPGFESRPDRILISEPGLKVDSVFTLGRGFYYERHYKNKLYWARINSIHEVAKSQAAGDLYDTSCHWDCGPHGVCRCGICVKKRVDDACNETYCVTCGPAKYNYYQFLMIIFWTMFALFFISLGICTSKFTGYFSRFKFIKQLTRTLLGSMYFLLAMVAGMLVIYFIFVEHFKDVQYLADSQIKEELFPSDHLMVVARIRID